MQELDKKEIYYVGDLTANQLEELTTKYNISKDGLDDNCIGFSKTYHEWWYVGKIEDFTNPRAIINATTLFKQEIKKGQIWEHIKTGERVEVEGFDSSFTHAFLLCGRNVSFDDLLKHWKLAEEETKPQQKGLRFNDGKPKWSLMDFDTLEGALRVFEFGTEKYGVDNWKKGLLTTGICESLMRHLVAYLNGQDTDKETNLPHVDHIICNAIILAYTQKFNNEFDDRRPDKNKSCCGNWDEYGSCKCK